MIKFLIYLLLFYFLFRFLFSVLFKIKFHRFHNIGNANNNYKSDGSITVSESIHNKNKKHTGKIGEYVDYEEVK